MFDLRTWWRSASSQVDKIQSCFSYSVDQEGKLGLFALHFSSYSLSDHVMSFCEPKDAKIRETWSITFAGHATTSSRRAVATCDDLASRSFSAQDRPIYTSPFVVMKGFDAWLREVDRPGQRVKPRGKQI